MYLHKYADLPRLANTRLNDPRANQCFYVVPCPEHNANGSKELVLKRNARGNSQHVRGHNGHVMDKEYKRGKAWSRGDGAKRR